MYLKNNKGVTLLALTITIIVMLIITGTIINNTNNHIKREKVNKLYNDIEIIDNKVDDYYLKYGELPIINTIYCNKSELEALLDFNASSNKSTLEKTDNLIVNPNDGDEYYIVDLERLEGLTLNYGCGDDYKIVKDTPERISTDIDEVYIINKATHQIYYPSGVFSDNYMYYCYELDINHFLEEKTITSSNGEIVFNQDDYVTFNNFKIYGNSQQDGETPTVDSPVEIQSVGNKTNNLFDSSNIEQGGAIDATGVNTSSNYRVRTKELIPLEAGTYTITSSDIYFRTIHVYNYDTEEWEERYWIPNKNTYTFTITENKKVKILFQYDTGNTVPATLEDVVNSNVMLAKSEIELEYEPYGYNIPIKLSGKNIFGFSTGEISKSNQYIDYEILDENSIKITTSKDTTSSAYWLVSINIDIKDYVGKTLTLSADYETSFESSSNKTYYRFMDENKEYLTSNTRFGKVIVPENACYLRLNLYIVAGDVTNSGDYIIISNIQIEENTEKTSFSPYIKPVITNIYLNEPLRKIGDYADYIDFKKQKIIKNVEVVDSTGTLTLEQSLRGLSTPIEDDIEISMIPIHQGSNIITVDTDIKPTLEISYYKINNE